MVVVAIAEAEAEAMKKKQTKSDDSRDHIQHNKHLLLIDSGPD